MPVLGFKLSGMRLDLFLKISRLVKRRTLAKDYCDAGRIKIGGASAKPARELKEGDQIALNLPRRKLVVEVVSLPKGNVSKETAADLYRVIQEEKKQEEW
jgi:ribosomal 50S subunit-recycling heat shock protein